MQRTTASAIVLVSLLASGVAAAQGEFDSSGEQQMLARINAMRAERQLAPLQRHDGLDAAARAHATDMAAQQQLTHVSPTSGTPADRVRSAGVSVTTVAQNVALHRTADQAQEALGASEAHRANMMNGSMTHVGLAALRTEQGVYVTQVFAVMAPPPPPAPAPVEAAPPAAEPERDDCISPIPGVSFCGPLPAPLLQEVQPPPPPIALPVPRIEQAPLPAPVPLPAPQASPLPAGPLTAQPGTNGTVLVQRTPDGIRVTGYWVYASNRWWWYPMPAGARPGQRLTPDLSVNRPPPGVSPHLFGAPRAVAPQRVMPPPQPRAQLLMQPQPRAQVIIQPQNGAFYAVPPPPMVGQPDRRYHRAHARWLRQYRRWLAQQGAL
jgi:cysteine-rich secretory family protein